MKWSYSISVLLSHGSLYFFFFFSESVNQWWPTPQSDQKTIAIQLLVSLFFVKVTVTFSPEKKMLFGGNVEF